MRRNTLLEIMVCFFCFSVSYRVNKYRIKAKLFYVIPYLQGAALSDELPNGDTIEAMNEVQNMIALNSSTKFKKDLDLHKTGLQHEIITGCGGYLAYSKATSTKK